MTSYRLPAEWEPQDAILLGWPHKETDWEELLPQVLPVFAAIAATISRYQDVLIPTPHVLETRMTLDQNGACMDRIHLFAIQTNDTWARDYGPITRLNDGRPELLDFEFNGWGHKFPAGLDNRITRELHQKQALGRTPIRPIDLVLEGGSIESNGQGTLLTTTQCLLEENRNPTLTRDQIQHCLQKEFGAEHFLWLEHGHLEGDDTDAHIDTLVRMAPKDTLLYVQCDDPNDRHFSALKAMEQQLREFRTSDGRPYRLIPLPWPSPCYANDGHRLPATYANFLILNQVVLMPTYNVTETDSTAITRVQEAFPDREVLGIDCRLLLEQHGSLHCLTMQLPAGVLS